MKKSKQTWILLAAIIAAGVLMRFWSLGSTELIHDEGLDAFRSIGYLDYLDSAAQSTPIQWFDAVPLPWWASLSFHDDPPLFFAVQHIFLTALEESLLSARLPSALAGIGAIILMYAIMRRLLRSDMAALIGAGTLSINFAHIWISRIAIIESSVVFFVLLNIYFFLRFAEDRRQWFWFGGTLGLVFLTKYTGVFLIPAYIVYLALLRRDILRNKYLYYALIVAAIMLSPVLIYNIGLFYSFGHFDLQIASLLGQQVSHWQGVSGKTQEPFSNIIQNLFAAYSIPFFVMFALAVASAALWHKIPETSRRIVWSAATLVCALFLSISAMLLAIGSAMRFVALYAIPGAMAIAMLAFIISAVHQNASRRWVRISGIALFSLFFLYESYFAINAVRVVYAADFGVMKLDRYFEEQFHDSRPPGLPQHPNPHLDAVIRTHARDIPNTLPPVGIIYDENTELAHSLWLFGRRQFYHGIPIMPAREFETTIQREGFAMFSGFTLYFVRADEGAPLSHGARLASAEHIEQLLKEKLRVFPDRTIVDDQGVSAFRVYKFSIR